MTHLSSMMAGRRAAQGLIGLCLPVVIGILEIGSASASSAQAANGAQDARPNVLLIMVDDMGYGDYSMAGHPDLQTPHLDAMASRSAQFDTFYVSPVCALTRAALMSGRYPHRVGVHVNGRYMAPGTHTIASDLKAAGYATGIFGKWHLGDYSPSRPVDFGFEKSLVCRGGIIGQLADKPNVVRYTDPFLLHDGKLENFEGYATDVYFEQAMAWMDEVHGEERSFFAYLAPNAPHKPYDDVPQAEYLRLRGALLAKAKAGLGEGVPLDAKRLKELDESARYFAMVERIDSNMGKLFDWLGASGLLEDTLVLFFSDNGPVPGRFNAGLRGGKGQMYEGGLKTQFFAHWPGHLSPEIRSKRIAAHIDLLPTILEACQVELEHQVDGVSVWSSLRGDEDPSTDRLLLFEAHQGRGTARQNYAVRSQDFKLVVPGGYTGSKRAMEWELYDMRVDPLEAKNLAPENPDRVQRLSKAFDSYAEELKTILLSTRRVEPRIEVGPRNEHPQLITRSHWKRTESGGLGAVWQLLVRAPGLYRAAVRFEAAEVDRIAYFNLRKRAWKQTLPAGEVLIYFEGVPFARGANFVECDVGEEGGALSPAWQMEILRTGELDALQAEPTRDRNDDADNGRKGRRKRRKKPRKKN